MKKVTRKALASVCATAMALTLAVPSTNYVKGTVVNAEEAEDSILATAIKTINFDSESGFEGEGLSVESEQRVKFTDGKPEVVSGEYVTVDATDELPEIIEDDTMGKVLEFKDYVKVDKVAKTESDELDDKYKIGDLIQQKERLSGRVKAENPYVGRDDLEGVTISYWVKVPVIQVNDAGEKVEDGTGEDRGANATTVVFNNYDRTFMNKDDSVRYKACQAYDQAMEDLNSTDPAVVAAAEDVLKDFSMGTQSVVVDNQKNVYVLYENYGKLIRLNPNYPSAEASGRAVQVAEKIGGTVKPGGYYGQESDKKVVWTADPATVTAENYNTVEENKRALDVSDIGKGEAETLYYKYAYRYAPEDDLENGFSSKSMVKEGVIQGSLQISTDNDFGFRADNYRLETYTDETGNIQSTAVDGFRCVNPNDLKEYGEFLQLESYNQFYFDGDMMVTDIDEDAPEKWHYVTIVIMNGGVFTYVDGIAADPEVDYEYMTDIEGIDHQFDKKNTAKMFNKGRGITDYYGGIFGLGETNVPDWSANGTMTTTPANGEGCTMMEWLADVNTELYLGGTGCAAEPLSQGYGSIEGVCLDDVSFFDYAMDEDQACALYEEALATLAGKGDGLKGDVNADTFVDTLDAIEVLKYAAGMDSKVTTTAIADVNGDTFVDTLDAIEILKYAAGMDSTIQ